MSFLISLLSIMFLSVCYAGILSTVLFIVIKFSLVSVIMHTFDDPQVSMIFWVSVINFLFVAAPIMIMQTSLNTDEDKLRADAVKMANDILRQYEEHNNKSS